MWPLEYQVVIKTYLPSDSSDNSDSSNSSETSDINDSSDNKFRPTICFPLKIVTSQTLKFWQTQLKLWQLKKIKLGQYFKTQIVTGLN